MKAIFQMLLDEIIEKIFGHYKHICIFFFICIATPTTSTIKNVTTVLLVMILSLFLFFVLLISLITYDTVAVLEIHLTNPPLWFMAIE